VGEEGRCGTETDTTEGRVVVLVRPRGELFGHLLCVGDVLKWLPEQTWERGKLRLEAEEHSGDGSLDFVDQRSSRVGVVEHHPLAGELLLVLEHLVEAPRSMGVLRHRWTEVRIRLSTPRLCSELLLGGHDLEADGRHKVILGKNLDLPPLAAAASAAP